MSALPFSHAASQPGRHSAVTWIINNRGVQNQKVESLFHLHHMYLQSKLACCAVLADDWLYAWLRMLCESLGPALFHRYEAKDAITGAVRKYFCSYDCASWKGGGTDSCCWPQSIDPVEVLPILLSISPTSSRSFLLFSEIYHEIKVFVVLGANSYNLNTY